MGRRGVQPAGDHDRDVSPSSRRATTRPRCGRTSNGVSKALESSQQQATAMEARPERPSPSLQELTQAEQAAAPAPPARAGRRAPRSPTRSGAALLLAQRTADGLDRRGPRPRPTRWSTPPAPEASTMVADAQRQAEVRRWRRPARRAAGRSRASEPRPRARCRRCSPAATSCSATSSSSRAHVEHAPGTRLLDLSGRVAR